MMPSNIVVDTSTVSGKWRSNNPESMSRSKLRRIGRVVSLMYAVVLRALEGGMGTTGLAFMSAMAVEAMLR